TYFSTDTATTPIYTLSLHDALPISNGQDWGTVHYIQGHGGLVDKDSITFDANSRLYATWDEGNVLAFTWSDDFGGTRAPIINPRSEEHTSELQSRGHLVCRLLLEKK